MPDRFGKVSVSAFVFGDDIDCCNGNIFDFAPEALGVGLLFSLQL